jgi:RelA/SpoT family (p)ppGpp synthetase
MAKAASNSQSTAYKQAYQFAKKAHAGQFRTSGEPYVTHVEAVAELLRKELNADEETLIAALLHDTVEDTDVTYKDIKAAFGPVVAKLVEGVTKVQQLEEILDKRERNMQSIRKMFRTMGKDIRVIFIKLSDRLHNMQTIGCVPIEKQLRIARETQDIYCPLADLLGIRAWYQQLSDSCFQVLEPAAYDLIRRKTETTRREQHDHLQKWLRRLHTSLKTSGWKNVDITLTPRHFRSIHDQTKGNEVELRYIETFNRVHIIIPDSASCYECMGTVHDFATPVPASIDDYIATPKINGYQALHTTVVTSTGNPIDIIIQTKSMAEQAKYGLAILYQHPRRKDLADLPAWIEALTSLEQDEKDLHAFFSMIQSEIFGERRRVYVLGSRKRFLDVPAHSSVLDVAYYAGERTGWQAQSAIVDNKSVSLKHLVHEGAIIQIVPNKTKSPRRTDDLNFLHTSLAQKMFIAQLTSLPRPERVRRGRELIHHTVDMAMDPFFSITWQKQVRSLVDEEPDTLESIGTGIVNPFMYLEENSKPEDFFLLDPSCFQLLSRLSPSTNMRYVLRTDLDELRTGNIIGVQVGPDIIDVISAKVLAKERRFSKEYVPLKIRKEALANPLYFALRLTFEADANPLEGISTLQSLLDTPVKLLQFENTSVTLGFHTDRLRTLQMAYEYLYGLPYVLHLFRITP